MNLNIFSVVIILIILLMGLIGSKRGILKELVVVFGTVLVFILAFIFKDFLAGILCKYLPFFNFRIPLGNLATLNIIFYQLIAFLLLVIVFRFILQIIINITGIFNKIINATIILALPNKILGFIVGIIEGYILMFILLNVIAIPLSGNELFTSSKVRNYIVNDTPVLRNCLGGLNTALEDILNLDSKDENNTNNLKIVDTLLKYDVVTPEFMEEIVDNGKLKEVTGIDAVINKYKEEK